MNTGLLIYVIGFLVTHFVLLILQWKKIALVKMPKEEMWIVDLVWGITLPIILLMVLTGNAQTLDELFEKGKKK